MTKMLSYYLLFVYEEEDKPQFERLYYKYDKILLQKSNGILKNQQDAEDAVQEAWSAIAQNMHILRHLSDEKIEIYIFKTVKCKSINIYHKNHRIEYDFDCNVLASIPADIDIPADFVKDEEIQAAQSYLNSLHHRYRDVLTLSYLYHMKPAKIAETLDRPLQTVKSQIRRGKRLLREKAKELRR